MPLSLNWLLRMVWTSLIHLEYFLAVFLVSEKSVLVKLITEQLKKILKQPGQDYENKPSVLVTALTGKTATDIDGTTLNSTFNLPINGKRRFRKKKLSCKEMHEPRA